MKTKQNMLIALMLMLVTMLSGPTAEAKKVTIAPNGTMQVVKGDDTVNVSLVGRSRLGVNLSDVIDDTLININQDDSAAVAAGGTWRDDNRDEWEEHLVAVSNHWSKVAGVIVMIICLTVLAIVVLVLLFRYLNRCRKLRVIEKAIECNYPLTGDMLGEGKRTILVQQQQPIVVHDAAATEANNSGAAVGTGDPATASTVMGTPLTVSFMSWDVWKSPIKWLAWGVGLTLFGFSEGATPFWSIGFALIVVGAAKAYIRYQEIKSVNAQLQRQQNNTVRQQSAPTATPPQFSQQVDDNSLNQR